MTIGPRKNAGKTRGKPFGQGNSGRPKGVKNRVTLAVEGLFENEGKKIARVCVEKALAGDTVALRLILERIAPLRRGRPVQLDLPAIDTIDDLVKATGVVLGDVAAGSLTPEEGSVVAGIIETRRRTAETVELEGRIARLEQAQAAEDETP